MNKPSTSTSHDPSALQKQLDHYAEWFESELNQYLKAIADPPVPNLHDAVTYALGADIDDSRLRGKRIRPVLCLLSAEALGADPAHAMPFALAIELMHNFALVHDDIEDGDVMRRGRDATHIRYGLPHGINIGDYLLVHTTRALAEAQTALPAETRLRLIQLIGQALDHTHIGQALEINYRGTADFSEQEYLRIVREKTGYYLAAPIQGGAIVAGANYDVIERIGAMAQFLGPLFQIIDDIIDLTEGKGREAIGSDLREGKRSFLIAHVAERCKPAEKQQLFAILDKERTATTDQDIARAIELFQQYDAIEAGRRYCQELYENSRRELKQLPPALASVLGPVFEMLVNRKK